MRIAALQIDSFGVFRDLALTKLPPGLVLIQGDNEAGKSTLLWFLRGMLFGFPDGRSKDPRYLLADGAAHGGQLDIVTDNGGRYSIARRGTRGGGEVTITDGEDVSHEEEMLINLLGGTTAPLYRNVYAFSLAELHTIDSLQAEGVRGAIYGATAGTAMLALPQALKRLDDRLDDAFRPRGQKQQINRRLAELDSITESLRDAFKGLGQYDEACTQLNQTQALIDEVRARLSGLRSEATMVAAYLQLWPDWINFQECTAELTNLPMVVESFPEDGLALLETALEGLQARREHLQDSESKRAAVLRDADDLEIDARIIAQGEAISGLTERRAQYIAARDNLPLLRQKRDSVDGEVGDILRRLGPGWTESKIPQTDCSVVAREAIREHEQALDLARAEVARTEQDCASRRETHKIAVADERAAHEEVETYADIVPVDETLVRDLQNGRALFREAVHDLPRVEADLKSARKRVDEGIREIDARWSLDNVSRFDVSLAAQRRIQEFAHRFETARQAWERADLHRTTKDELLRESRAQLAALTSDYEILPESAGREAIAQRRAALIALKAASQQRAHYASEARNAQSRLDDKRAELERWTTRAESTQGFPWWLMLIGLCGGVAVLAVGWATEQLPLAAIVLAVSATLAFVWSRVTRAQSADTRSANAAAAAEIERDIAALTAELEKLHGAVAKCDETITEHASTLSLSATPAPAEIGEAEQALEREHDALKHHEQLQGELRKQTDELRRREKELHAAEQALKQREEELETVQRDWGAHLATLGLAPGSAVETIQLVFTKVQALRDQVAELANKAERIERMTASRDSYLALARRVSALAPHCEGAASDLTSAVDRFFEDARRQHERLQERELAQNTLADAQQRSAAAAAALQTAEEALTAARRQQDAAWGAWHEYLELRGLAVDLSPPTALEALQLVEKATDRLTERRQLDETIAQLKAQAAAYEDTARAVVEALQRRVPMPADLPARIEELGRELELSRDNTTRRHEMERQAESLSQEIEAARSPVDEASQRIASLLEKGGAADEDSFRERGRWFARRSALQASIEQAASTMRKIAGEIDLDTLKAKLAATSREQLEVRRQEVDLGIAETDDQLTQLRDAKAELTNKIESMKTADDVARLRARQERVLAEIRTLALQWSRLAVARWLLLQARKKFEEEQQPKVVRDAAGFFTAMTHDRYAKIIAPVGADTIEVVTNGGERRKPDELSRGTAEQLYLALRFGYIRLRGADHERLPVVMDDILVNFDPQRASKAAAAILELADEHQVLFFTCHPETVERFRQHDASLTVYRLQDGTMSAPPR